MSLSAALLALVVSASPHVEQARYWLWLGPTPVGVVELKWDPASGEYTYRSTHLFTRGESRDALRKEERLRLDGQGHGPDGLLPASWALWRRSEKGLPTPGHCAEVHDELHARARLCVDATDARTVRGSQDGTRFVARYGGDGRLASLELPGAHLQRASSEARLQWPEDVLGKPIPVAGSAEGVLVLAPHEGEPNFPALRDAGRSATREELEALDDEVARSFDSVAESSADLASSSTATVGSCLAHAARWVERAKARGIAAQRVCGLYVEPGSSNSVPHAWVRALERFDRGSQIDERDPTLHTAPTRETHLMLGPCDEQMGQQLIRLYEGSLRLERR